MATLPSKDALLAWIRDNPGETSKRDVARAFGIKGAERVELKRMLKELEAEGQIQRDRKQLRDPSTLPPVSVLRVTGVDGEGDLWAEPAQWEGAEPIPRILIEPRPGEPALGEGDRIAENHAQDA